MTDTAFSSRSRIISKYYLYKAIGNPGFIYPIYVLYLLSHGLSYAEIGTIGAIQGVIVVTGELPTGYVSDRIGRRNSMVLAQVLYTLSTIGMILGEGFLAFTFAFALLSFGTTFVSGSEQAWLYETLAENLDEDTYTHVKGRGAAVGQWVMAATMIAGSFLYVVGPVYPFVAVLVMRVLTGAVVLTLPKNKLYTDESDEDGSLTVLEALPVIRERITAPALRWFVVYAAVFFGATMAVDVYVQPITVTALESSIGPYLATAGLPEAASIGFLYAAFTAVSAVASDHASNLESRFGVRGALFVLPVGAGLLMLAPVVLPLLAFPMFFGVKGAQSLVRPIIGQYLNDRLAAVGRATVLSTVSMIYASIRIPLTLGSGVLADVTSPIGAVGALGVFFLVVGSAVFLWLSPVESGQAAGASDVVAD